MTEITSARTPTFVFWNDKRVFVTGHSGFKGSWLTLWLSKLGAKVKGYSLKPSTQPNLFNKANISGCCDSTFADIRDLEILKYQISKFKPDIVFHLAAQSLVPVGIADPLNTYSTNIMGTANLLESCRGINTVKSIVIVTSDKCYSVQGNGKAFEESQHLGGDEPYSSSKASAEIVTHAYRETYFKGRGIASARAGNVIGGGDWSENRLFPDLIRAFESDRDLTLRAPDAVRPWQHVIEPVSGYLLLAEALYTSPEKFSCAWNFGPEPSDNIRVVDLVRHAYKLRNKIYEIQHQTVTYQETKELRLNNNKAKIELGWKPVWNIREALEKSISWYSRAEQKNNMQDLCLTQIDEYCESHSRKYPTD